MKGAVWTKELKEFADIGPRKSLAEEAADTLREFILLGKLPPGAPVPNATSPKRSASVARL